VTSRRRYADIARTAEVIENADGGENACNSRDDKGESIIAPQSRNHFINGENEKHETSHRQKKTVCQSLPKRLHHALLFDSHPAHGRYYVKPDTDDGDL